MRIVAEVAPVPAPFEAYFFGEFDHFHPVGTAIAAAVQLHVPHDPARTVAQREVDRQSEIVVRLAAARVRDDIPRLVPSLPEQLVLLVDAAKIGRDHDVDTAVRRQADQPLGLLANLGMQRDDPAAALAALDARHFRHVAEIR